MIIPIIHKEENNRHQKVMERKNERGTQEEDIKVWKTTLKSKEII